MNEHRITDSLQAVQMQAESGCSRCDRRIPLLAFAFLGPNYEAVCAHCAAKQIDDLVKHLEAERDSRLTKEAVRGKLAAEIPTWFQSWIDHHKAEQELAENSDDPVAAKQHEVAVEAFEDATRYALHGANAAFGEEDSGE